MLWARGFVQSTIDVAGATIAYHVRDGSHPPLVMIPGSFNEARALRGIIDELDDALSIVVVDLRGHGGSWPPTANGSIELFAQNVLRVVDRLLLTNIFIGGHSIGGMIALEVTRVRPQVLQGVISIEGWTNHHAQRDAFQDDTMSTLSDEQRAERERLRPGRLAPLDQTAAGRICRHLENVGWIRRSQSHESADP